MAIFKRFHLLKNIMPAGAGEKNYRNYSSSIIETMTTGKSYGNFTFLVN